jgi:hypothetical protein
MQLYRDRPVERTPAERAPDEIEPGNFTEAEAARFLRIGTRTLSKLRAAGRGPKFVRCGRSIRYPRHLLLAFLDERAEGGAP